MEMLKVTHPPSGKVLGARVERADGIVRRTVGLMFREAMGEIDGLMLERSNSVHTCFMRFPMDAVFLAPDGTVVKVIRGMLPWRFTWMYWRASRVLELPGGGTPPEVVEGEKLEVTHV